MSEKSMVEVFVDVEKLTQDTAINPNDIDDAMCKQASLYAFYAEQARKARRQYERMKSLFEILESKLDNEHRTRLKEESAKTTEQQISTAVKNDPRWWAMQQQLIEARGVYDLASDAREAFSQRRDMIIQVASDRREERKGAMRMAESAPPTKEEILRSIKRLQESNTAK
jgi:hypothetical protein